MVKADTVVSVCVFSEAGWWTAGCCLSVALSGSVLGTVVDTC